MSSTAHTTEGQTAAEYSTTKTGHHHYHGKSDARAPPRVDCVAMHKEDALAAAEKLKHDEVHHYEGQPDDQRLRADNILKDPKSPADAKLNALDSSEALPHGGYLRGDL
ncbi:uncharacterized protein RHOBADRAFT_47619 [Rhodotorula graminis WP1]|uniref:Uncharacterized protein n=1 Tax=Rhodotorula graminis (strain WP1) TaxID=578459 RepID=A0A0P9EQ65_RHOGW|nr:uncharacterized protein RHOBADRAFT_47619 [Rhodotorula graminis WP1]KPV71662.1 hypothetical protein RHOBADRAFT_47619 [Rhodotorula graminis WP1]